MSLGRDVNISFNTAGLSNDQKSGSGEEMQHSGGGIAMIGSSSLTMHDGVRSLLAHVTLRERGNPLEMRVAI